MKRVHVLGFVILVCALLLGACRQQPAALPEGTQSPLATPDAETVLTSPLASPQDAPLPLEPLPTPSSPDVSVVGGMLMRDLGETGVQPMAKVTVQLAKIIKSADGSPMMAAAGEGSSPTAETTDRGQFIFTDVPPGDYSIVVATAVGSFLIKDAQGNDILIEVDAGEIVDVGQYTTDLPF